MTPIVLVGEADQFGTPLDRDAERLQPLDQEPLVLILRKDVQERVGRQVRADAAERNTRRGLALHPQIDGGNLVARRDHRLREIELPVEFERARLHRQRARGGAGLGGLVDDADLDAEFCQPKRQHQTGRPGADDQNVALRHVLLHLPAPHAAASAGNVALPTIFAARRLMQPAFVG